MSKNTNPQQPTSSDPELYAAYCERVKGPGKFTDCAPYVPYYWDIYLNDAKSESEDIATEDARGNLVFPVDSEDRKLFPELKRRRWIALHEDDNGSVSEV